MLTYYYAVYIVVSAALTIWVAHSLSTRGRVFLVHFMDGKEQLADSVNRLLVVGLYLVSLGSAMLALSFGRKPVTLNEFLEELSFKVGLVLVVLGVTHLFNMRTIGRLGGSLDEMLRKPRTAAEPVPPASASTVAAP